MSSEQGEGLYEQVRQDEQLRRYHMAKLLATSGYESLTEQEAGEMIELMLRLSTLLYELVLEEERPTEPATSSVNGKNSHVCGNKR